MLSINAFLLKTQQSSSPAIQSDSIEMNYDQLRQKVLKSAAILKSFGIKENENVAIVGNNDIDFITNVLALWQLNAVPVLINPQLATNEVEDQTAIADCDVVLLNKAVGHSALAEKFKVIQYPFEEKIKTEDRDYIDELNPDDTAIIIFTSGTAGNPKGVELSFNCLIQSAKVGDQIIHHSQNDRWLASLPFYHIGGFLIITRSLLYQTVIILPKNLQTDALAESTNNFKPTLCSLVPTQLRRLMEADIRPNKELRNVLLGGGYIDQRLVTDAIYDGWNITKVYGSTETTAFVTALPAEEFLEKPTSVGKAVHPNLIVIVNENRYPLPEGEAGEIAVSSAAILKGYYNNEEETEKNIENGFYYTGDIGYLDTDGYLFLEARRTDMIVTGGENVNPNEVENRILEHPDIIDAAVFPLRDDDWGEIVAAVIVKNNSVNNITLDDLEQFLQDSLAGFKIPKKLFFDNKIPKDELGKISRDKLVERYEGI